MARGSVSKETVANKILAAFPGAFKYDKEIRIPIVEEGETIQIKVTLTAAKTNVEAGGDTAVPGCVPVESSSKSAFPAPPVKTIAASSVPIQPTEEEKKNVASLLSMLGL